MSKRIFLSFGGVPTAVLMSAVLLGGVLAGCTLFGSDEHEDKLTLRFSMKHMVDSSDLVLHSLQYTNAAGNQYKVEELKYILSDIKLHDHDGSVMAHVNKVLYFDAAVESTLVKEFEVLEPKHYHSMSFVFGIVPEKNKSGEHDNTIELQRMGGWSPGGGYHFMQLEGKYIKSNQAEFGLLTHMGRSVTDTLTGDPHFVVEGISLHETLADGDELSVTVSMNINQWYQDPNVYDFNDYGDIMPNPAAQLILRENGMNGVFSADSVTVNQHDHNDHHHD